MKIKFHIVSRMPHNFTTIGYWAFDGLMNSGTLQIYCCPLSRKRYRWAVIGHELIEAIYCWLFRITTETCDRWDAEFEKRYDSGESAVEIEPGDDPECPYHWGHFLGCCWERLFIALTIAGWRDYVEECEGLYHAMNERPTLSQKTLP